MNTYVFVDTPPEIQKFVDDIHKKNLDSVGIRFENNFCKTQFCPTYNKDDIFPGMHTLLEISCKLLNANGFYTIKNFDHTGKLNMLIELHEYNKENNTPDYETPFAKHCDDYGAVDTKVNTIIYYIEKSEELEGGNIKIFKDENNIDSTLKVESSKMLMMRGDVMHEITPLKGRGIRRSIVVQIERLEDICVK